MMGEILGKYKVLERKITTRAGRKKSQKKPETIGSIKKRLAKAKTELKDSRLKLLKLEAEQSKLEKAINETSDRFEKAKSQVISLSNALKNSALVDSNKVVFHSDDCSDVSYIIDGEEYHMLDDGTTKLRKDYIKEQRKKEREQKQKELECSDCNDFNKVDDEEELELTQVDDDEKELELPQVGEEFPPYRFKELTE